MNIKQTFKTSIAAVAIATAPLTAAAKGVVADSIRTEHSVVQEGGKWISTIKKVNKNTGKVVSECSIASNSRPAGYKAPGEPKDKEGVFRVGVNYSTRDILGLRTNEPRLKAQFDGRSEHIVFRPEVTVGTETYHVVLPVDYVSNVGKGASFEAGADLAGVRGFYNGKSVFFEKDVNRVITGEDCKARDYTGEFFQNVHVGGRYKNDVVNLGARVEAGRTAYISGCFVKEAPGANLSQIEASGTPILPRQSSGYVGARTNVEVTPFAKNRNLAFNAEGAVATNKGPEASVGVAYKF